MKLRLPDQIKIFSSSVGFPAEGLTFSGGGCSARRDDVFVSMSIDKDDEKSGKESLALILTAVESPVKYLRLRWNFSSDEKRENVRICGDAWERAYGDLEWRGAVPERIAPWYMLVADGKNSSNGIGRCDAYGVKTQPSALASWQYDPCGVTLWCDVRCGGEGVILGGRRLRVCDIIMEEYDGITSFEAGRLFCGRMCSRPLRPPSKIYGSNNWYYAVGKSSHEEILRDAELISSLAEGLENRPYMVIDDGWQKNPCDGPWDQGGEKFPDMARLAREIEDLGALPGIWVRLLADKAGEAAVGADAHLSPRPDTLDPSTDEVIDYVKETISRFVQWGYKLIKHDFTAFDMLGRYGNEMGKGVTAGGWSFADRSRTTAEITVSLYRAILEAAGNAVIIGCNTLSHLSAGLVHLMRVGYDTSGRYWERTRGCGVNALAFRMIQHKTFYDIDADCFSITGILPRSLNGEWLRLLADSGTPLFVSVDPDKVTEEEKNDLRAALKKGSMQTEELIPLDWMDNTAPERYLSDGKEKRYLWYPETGTFSSIPPEE